MTDVQIKDSQDHNGYDVKNTGLVTHNGVQSIGGNARGAQAVDLQTSRSGVSQVASGAQSTIGGGLNNTGSGNQSTIGGGTGNQATATFSAVPGGANAIASLLGQLAFASGDFATGGDAQWSNLIARVQTANNTPTEMFLNGSSSRLVLPQTRAWVYRILVVAWCPSSPKVGSWKSEGMLYRLSGGNVTLVGNTDTAISTVPIGWAYAATADTTNQSLKLGVTGDSAKTTYWVARIELVEVQG